MNIPGTRNTLACLIALALSACGGGGGSQLVREDPRPPDPPPPRPAYDPCPPPVTSDCNVDLAPDRSERLPGTGSDHALFLEGGGQLDLYDDNYRFGAGTHIQNGTLVVGGGATVLQSDVLIGERGNLLLRNRVQGSVINRGKMDLTYGTVGGNLDNAGRLEVAGLNGINPSQIDGDFTQSADGVLHFSLVAMADWQDWIMDPLKIRGRAHLDGSLELDRFQEGDHAYALPDARAHHLIHADGGVSGQFAQWTSPGFAITGELRYGSNDVWFDLERISLTAAITARGIANPLSQGSAANLDRALAAADAFALAPAGSLSHTRRRFLHSAASVMWQQDTAQAARSLDSLAGHAHAGVADAMRRGAADALARLDARLAGQDYDIEPVVWSLTPHADASGHRLGGSTSGVDQWLSPRLLVGGSVSDGRASLGFDRLGGFARGEAPGAGLHVHYRGSGWHATGAVGASRARLDLHRPIELGAAGRHLALSQRSLEHAFAHGELGRDLPFGGGHLLPFVALDYSVVRGDGFVEHGNTGFELVAGPSRQAQLSGAAGARYARDWSIGGQRMRLELDARYRRDLVEGDPVRAAFRGVPDAGFDLPAWREPDAGELRLGLGGGAGRHMRWSLDYAASFGRERRDQAWEFGLRHGF